jgi:hypothetical protein
MKGPRTITMYLKLGRFWGPTIISLSALVVCSTPAQGTDFAKQIAPILEMHCVKCHGPQKQQGGLRFDDVDGALKKGDSDEPAIVPGDATSSELIHRITSDDEFSRMPPQGERLTAGEIDLLKRWIDAGANWPQQAKTAPHQVELTVTAEDRQHWAYRPLMHPPVPAVRSPELVRTSIDAFILSALEAQGLRWNGSASPRTLLRRIKIDLAGLPPTVEELATFEDAAEHETYAIEKLIDVQLSSMHYGERWGRHWLDVARYADSHGQEGDQDRPHAFRYRDFVIGSLNEDMPFDQFARWQIAGNELEPNNALAVAATGFLAAGPSTELKKEQAEEEKAQGRFIERMRNRYNELDDIIATIGTGMLGLTLGCARCHDHKYDAIPTRDYYRLMSAFQCGDRDNVYLATPEEMEAYQVAKSKWAEDHRTAKKTLDQWLAEVRDSLQVSEDKLEQALTSEQLAHWNRLTAAVDELQKSQPPEPPQAFVYRDETHQPQPTWLFPRGDFLNPLERVELGFLSVLTSSKPAESYWQQERSAHPAVESTYQRAALAQWLTDIDNGAGALLARVVVNRVWQHHFGQGLVRTPNDFGVQGEMPTHPELLEWLASDFVEHGWRMKRLHRQIMTSHVYLQGITFDENNARIDPENRLLWRRQPRRVEAETLRDAILLAAGTMNFMPYGPGFKPPIPKEAMVARNLKSPYDPEPADSANVLRRSVYMFQKRVIPDPLMELFDRPASSQSCGRRQDTLVAPQALALLNDPFVRTQAEQFAMRLMQQREETAGRVRLAFETSLARLPEEHELTVACEFIATRQAHRAERAGSTRQAEAYQAALADYCQILFGLNEFLYID